MRTFRVSIAALPLLLSLVSCNTDPNVGKARYLEMGNKYYDHGKYKQANIMYRRALEKDKLFGEAYYHLALTDLKEGNVNTAVPDFRKAVDLIKPDKPDHWDALTKVTDIYLVV